MIIFSQFSLSNIDINKAFLAIGYMNRFLPFNLDIFMVKLITFMYFLMASIHIC